MATITPATKLTYADLLLWPEDGQRHELIDGEHSVSGSPTVRHQRVLRDLFMALAAFVEQHGLGEVLFAPLDVLLSDHDVLEPDLFYVARERSSLLAERCVHGAPDLVVEVRSQSTRTRDLGPKRSCYEKFGVAEYWVVDPDEETLDVFRQSHAGGSGLHHVARLHRAAGGGPLTSPLFPGLALGLERIFR
jgi:Uma2 family endonuclease